MEILERNALRASIVATNLATEIAVTANWEYPCSSAIDCPCSGVYRVSYQFPEYEMVVIMFDRTQIVTGVPRGPVPVFEPQLISIDVAFGSAGKRSRYQSVDLEVALEELGARLKRLKVVRDEPISGVVVVLESKGTYSLDCFDCESIAAEHRSRLPSSSVHPRWPGWSVLSSFRFSDFQSYVSAWKNAEAKKKEMEEQK